MLRSLFSGVSGLSVHQTKMDVIANNVSNVNTVGFKKSSATFSDVMNQTVSGATAASDTTGRGGTNAMQIGLGSTVSAISTVMTTGSAERTDKANDIMISGDGFFVVSDATGYYFTRAGAFEVDEQGNLTDSNGLSVCGWSTDETGKVIQGKASPLNLYEGTKSYLLPETTSNVTFTGNLNTSNSPQLNTVSFYDSLGNKYTVEATFTYSEDTTSWTVVFYNMATVNNDSSNKVKIDGLEETMTIKFDEDGTLINNEAGQNLQLKLQLSSEELPYNSVFADEITVDFSQLTQFNARATAMATNNGYEAGSIKGYSIGSDGIITGSYTNGLQKVLGQIVIADFPNPSGLEKVGSNLYTTTANSGDFDGIGSEVGANGGEFITGSLEMSNVDLAYEFTQMITTQRGYQANSRVITTSDELLQELVNLKR